MTNPSKKKSRTDPSRNVFWISVSDLMAATVFVFLIVLASFSLQIEHEQNMFRETKLILKSSIKSRHEILVSIQAKLRRSGLESEILTKQGILRINSEMIGFPASITHPKPSNLVNVGILARVLAKVLPCYSLQRPYVDTAIRAPAWCSRPQVEDLAYSGDGTRSPEDSNSLLTCNSQDQESRTKIDTVIIEGHTDATPVKKSASYPDNLALSAMRAGNIWKLLRTCQPGLEELFNPANRKIFGVSGYAFLRPAYPDHNDARNRRIDIRFVMVQPDEIFAGAEGIDNDHDGSNTNADRRHAYKNVKMKLTPRKT